MAEPTPLLLSRQFTGLINRKVSFAVAKPFAALTVNQVYGIYTVFPAQTTLVVRADLALFGSFAGALVGLPDSEVKSRLKTGLRDELLGDAMKEVFNVSSAVLTLEGRAHFNQITTELLCLSPGASKTMDTAIRRSCFNVEVEGYQGGRIAIFE
jgi:hypothetical protein